MEPIEIYESEFGGPVKWWWPAERAARVARERMVRPGYMNRAHRKWLLHQFCLRMLTLLNPVETPWYSRVDDSVVRKISRFTVEGT